MPATDRRRRPFYKLVQGRGRARRQPATLLTCMHIVVTGGNLPFEQTPLFFQLPPAFPPGAPPAAAAFFFFCIKIILRDGRWSSYIPQFYA